MQDGVRHFRHPGHQIDIMHADDVRAARDADRHSRGSAFFPFRNRQVQHLADEGLARRADQQREAQRFELVQIG